MMNEMEYREKYQDIVSAEEAVRDEQYWLKEVLEHHWPVGQRVFFWRMYGQINPSSGTVIGHATDGHLIIRPDSGKQTTVRIHWRYIDGVKQ